MRRLRNQIKHILLVANDGPPVLKEYRPKPSGGELGHDFISGGNAPGIGVKREGQWFPRWRKIGFVAME